MYMLGKTISHYKILEELGRGGMGVVYKAVDLDLERAVAIKFLPQHLSTDSEATQRFMNEAKTASALDHQHIGTIYEIGRTDDGQTFIVMAYYEGETLLERIDRGGMDTEEAIEIAAQIASGLAKAHEKDIVHRDIKPSNIIITKDREAKIIDFGLAKLAGKTKLTKEGSTLGTAAYMSPEQARGEEVDHRSDIFSLGSILYEMLAGEPSFKGEHEAALLYCIVHEEPKPLPIHKDNLPVDSQNIVDKALKKNANDRYQKASEMLSDLKSLLRKIESVTSPKEFKKSMKRSKLIATSIVILVVVTALILTVRHFIPRRLDVPAKRKMIAVLPFANLGSPEDAYFADGITDAITARLVRINGLGVIARQSVIQYKDSQKSIQTIAEELGVEYILEGTVQRERPSDPTSKVRVIPQLIRATDGIHLWADTYDEEMTEIFEIQSKIAERVATELNVVLLDQDRQTLQAKLTDNLEAYEYYLQGREYEERSIRQNDLEISIELFEKAAGEDPNFAEAYARIALQQCLIYWHGYDHSEERLGRAKDAIEKALSLKPNEPLVRAANGYYYYYGLRDYSRALDEFYFAQRKEPGNALYNASIAYVQRRLGKFDKALQNSKIAFQLDPRSHFHAYVVGMIYVDLRMFTEAEDYCDRAISLAPDIGLYYVSKAAIRIGVTGGTRDAREVLEQALDRMGPLDFAWDLTYFDIFDGHYKDALDRLMSIQEEVDARQKLYKPKDAVRGLIYELMGQEDQARDHYNKARTLLEQVVGERSGDARVHAELGEIYAHLGLKDEAIREGEVVADLAPISLDVCDGSVYATHVAAIYAILGDHEAAIDILERLPLMSIGAFSGYIGALEVNPVWFPLHDNPRFQRLLKRDE